MPAWLLLPLAGDLPPALRGSQFASSTWDAVPVILLLGVLGLYLWGVARTNRLRPRHPWPAGRTWAFAGGVLVTAISIFSFIGVYDSVLFWDHMVQHLLLIMVAAALFAIGSPMALLFAATSGREHEWVKRFLRSGPAKFFAHPVTAFILYAVLVPVTHLTSFYNYTLTHESVHDLEHALFLVIGYLFWRQIFGIEPSAYRLHPAMKMVYLFIAVPVDTFVGLSLAGADHELFPAYTDLHRTWGPSLVKDLNAGGTIMWVGGDTLMTLAMIPVVRQWVHLEERRAARADRELDRAGYSEVRATGYGPAGTTAGPAPSR